MDKPLTEEQEKMLEALALEPATPDDKFPELTVEQLVQFKRISTEKRVEQSCRYTTESIISPVHADQSHLYAPDFF